jgi:type IV pilus assembly protein PilB
MDDPLDLVAIDEIERTTRLRVRPVFSFRENLHRMVQRVYQDGFEVDTVTADMDEEAVEVQSDASELDVASVDEQIEGSPVINLVNYLILQAVRKKASDIHIEPGRKFSNVRFRVDGQLQEMLRPRRDIHPAIVSRIKVMGRMDIAEHHLPQDGRCQVAVEKKEIDLRISTLPTIDGEKVVIRILDRGRLTFDLEKLGIAGGRLTDLKKLLRKPHGLVLVTGPTGSGKTTTLYSGLELIKSVHNNIITVEDPVEYQIDLVNQVQVDKSRGLDFAGALRSILRQDPDVIMLGEIRDGETANVAVQAALTGHLVISTLHTNDSCGAITRLIDMGTPAYKVSAALQGVIAQRLVRTICPHCRANYYPTKEYLQSLEYRGDTRHRFQRGEGCRECYDTGHAGRRGIYEVLMMDSEVRRLISQNVDSDQLKQHFENSGGVTLLQAGLELAEQHVTSLEEVSRVAFAE